jgi:hypothetical protein
VLAGAEITHVDVTGKLALKISGTYDGNVVIGEVAL